MNCHDVEKLITEGQIERPEVAEHVAGCEACRQKVAFDRWLTETLDQELVLDRKVEERILDRAAASPSRRFLSFISGTQGKSIMKKTIWTAAGVAALTLGLSTFMAPKAEAATPKTKFAAMKKALSTQEKGTKITLKIDGDLQGNSKTTALINGQVVELQNGVPFEYQDGNTKVNITSSYHAETYGLDNLTPEQRKQAEEMLRGAMQGLNGAMTSENQVVVVNGKVLEGKEKEEYLRKHGPRVRFGTGENGLGVSFEFDFDFNEGSYSNIAFGSNENTLMLTPKKRNDVRYAVALDPKTNLPTNVTMQRSKNGKWTNVKNSKFDYKPTRRSV